MDGGGVCFFGGDFFHHSPVASESRLGYSLPNGCSSAANDSGMKSPTVVRAVALSTCLPNCRRVRLSFFCSLSLFISKALLDNAGCWEPAAQAREGAFPCLRCGLAALGPLL